MPAEFADFVVWVLRLALLAGLGWGAWLCLGQVLPERPPQLEHFATYALLVLLLTTIGGILHAV